MLSNYTRHAFGDCETPECEGTRIVRFCESYTEAAWIGYAEGQRDMLAKCITAVDRLGNKTASWRVPDRPNEDYFVAIVDAVTALSAVLEGENQ